MEEVNHSIDTRRAAREHEKAMAETQRLTFGMLKPLVEYQGAMFRLFADTLNVTARHYENNVDILLNMAEQQRQKIEQTLAS